ncbi:MAG: penicillin-binding protein 1C [Candidatus Muiribacteriota bacterium]
MKKYLIYTFFSLCFIIILIFILIPVPSFENNYSTIVLDENSKYLRVYMNSNEQYIFPPENHKLPENFVKAILTFEDKRFYSHFGVDLLAVLRSLYLNVKHGEIISGASTITMQIARMSSNRKRTFINKFIEIIEAIKLEFKYTKDELLRIYVNHAPYGGNIRGYKAAAFRYFGKNAKNLTWNEAAILAVLPNSPKIITPEKRQHKLIDKKNNLLNDLYKKDIINHNIYSLSKEEKMNSETFDFPFYAPHLCDFLTKRTESQIINTSINLSKQKKLKPTIEKYGDRLKKRGINNLSVVVLNKEAQVISYFGNRDYWDKEHQGMVDGVQAPRSTGSILKPVLYASAIDKGIIIPETVLFDIPTFFSGFVPKNFDGKFRGVVNADEALASSLNIPAIRLLHKFGFKNFYNMLNKSGITTLHRSPSEYGLSMVTGGVEGKLIEVTQFYNSLLNLGQLQKVSYLKDKSNPKSRIFDSFSAYLTNNILNKVKRPGIDYYLQKIEMSKQIYWKTGTSNGFRDSWAVGFNGEYTVGVWSGNFTGEGNPEITGAKASAAVFFDIINSLKTDKKIEEPSSKTINICSDTGYKASINCINIKEAQVPDKFPVISECPYHTKYIVDKNREFEVCSRCWTGKRKEEIRLIYPPAVTQFLINSKNNPDNSPVHNPDCPSSRQDKSIEIVYPDDESTIFAPRGIEGKIQKVKFEAASTRSNSEIFWYLNGELINKTSHNHLFYHSIKNGTNEIFIIDTEGNSYSVTVTGAK